MNKPGKQTTEFYVTLGVLGVLALQYLGVDLSAADVQHASEAVQAIADGYQQAQEGNGMTWVGIAYIVGRSLVKYAEARGSGKGGED